MKVLTLQEVPKKSLYFSHFQIDHPVYENNEILNKQMIKQISDLDKSNNVNNLNNSKNTQNFANDSMNLQNLTNDSVNDSTKALNDKKGIDGLRVILDYTKKLWTKKSLNNTEQLIRRIFANGDVDIIKNEQIIKLDDLALPFKNFIDLIAIAI